MKSLIFISFFLYSFVLQAGQPSTVYFENAQVRITQQVENCNDEANGTYRQYIFLQFENLTNKKIEVTFKKELWYNDQCTTCEKHSGEYLMNVALSPKQTVKGSCELRERAFSVFSKMLDKTSNSVLSKFELKNIQVNITE